MSLFDDIVRTVDRGIEDGESRFGYWNRSGRPGFSEMRARIDELVESYPAEHRDGMVIRLRSSDDVAHQSAMFELLLHRSLVCSGATIEAIEPALPHTDKSPDFQVASSTGEQFYLEATLATGLSDKERRSKRLLESAVHAVDDVKSSDFWLDATFEGTPSEPIKLKALRTSVEKWLATLDYDRISDLWPNDHDRDDRPSFKYSHAGLQIDLKPIPKPDRRIHDRAIGVQFGGVWSRTVGAALRQSIEGKANRYGDLNLPFVVAVNGLDHNAEEHDVVAALLGQQVYRYVRGPDAVARGSWDRDWNGVWTTPNRGPRRQGVSGVLAFDGLSVWSAEKTRGLFVHNPWARRALTASPIDVDRLVPVEGELVKQDGRVFSEILGWPAILTAD